MKDVGADLKPTTKVKVTFKILQQAVREAATICPRPCKLTFDLMTLKDGVLVTLMWATYVPILVFLGLSVLDLCPIHATDKQTSDVRRASSLNAPTLGTGA